MTSECWTTIPTSSYVRATIDTPECNVLASTAGQFLRIIIKVQSMGKNKHPVVVIATRSDQVQFWQDFAKQRTTVGDKTECVKSQDSIRRL
ncbi:hypothetical protein QE152_g33176 [Popillia japonica]|uniref:Uncharacterized protein n=1 Tax=Popillia japonica TaxID=7064 RepID=A0AAW1IX88_POPJA